MTYQELEYIVKCSQVLEDVPVALIISEDMSESIKDLIEMLPKEGFNYISLYGMPIHVDKWLPGKTWVERFSDGRVIYHRNEP